MKLMICTWIVAAALGSSKDDKSILAVYDGGKGGYSSKNVVLYTKQKFIVYYWTHSSGAHMYKGYWRREGNFLVLCPKKEFMCDIRDIFRPARGRMTWYGKRRFKKHGQIEHAEKKYRISGDTLKMYSYKDSVDNYSYHTKYNNLFRVKN